MASRSRALPTLASVVCLLIGLTGSLNAQADEMMVLGAASLTDVLPRVADAWKKSHAGIDVKLSFDGSSRLAAQIEQGAPADVFISADTDWMDHLQKAGKIEADSRQDILGNEIVSIVPAGARVPTSVKDLEDPAYKKIALAGENVPISKYAKAAFEKLGVWDTLQPRVVRGENVRTNLKWVEEKEVDAGVVYRTDAMSDSKVKIGFTFPKDSYPPVVYPAAVISASKSKKLAADFLDFCRTKLAQAIFQKAGFTSPKGTSRK